MKKILTTLLISAFALGCSAEEPKEPKVEPKETKMVCIDKVEKGKPVLDKKGNVVQICKEMKVHKKLEGTKVPEKK